MSRLTPESIRASQAELPPIGTVITELRRQDPYIQQEQHRYRSPRGFQHWANHLADAALIEARRAADPGGDRGRPAGDGRLAGAPGPADRRAQSHAGVSSC
jgi:hypothetical protein